MPTKITRAGAESYDSPRFYNYCVDGIKSEKHRQPTAKFIAEIDIPAPLVPAFANEGRLMHLGVMIMEKSEQIVFVAVIYKVVLPLFKVSSMSHSPSERNSCKFNQKYLPF